MPPAPRANLPRRLHTLITDPAPPPLARTAPWFLLALAALAFLHARDIHGSMGRTINIYIADGRILDQLPAPTSDGAPTWDEYWSGSLNVEYDLPLLATHRTVTARLRLTPGWTPDHDPLPPPTTRQMIDMDRKVRDWLGETYTSFGPFNHVPVNLGPLVAESIANDGAPVHATTPRGYLLKAAELLALAILIACPVVVAVRLAGRARCQRMLNRWSRARCPTCNYDISPDPTATCPECGTNPLAARQHALESLNRRLRKPEYAEIAKKTQRPQKYQMRSDPEV